MQATSKHNMEHRHRLPPALVVLGEAPQVQLLSGRGRVNTFFVQCLFALLFLIERWRHRKWTSTIVAGSKGSVPDAWRRSSLLVIRTAGEGEASAPVASWLVLG